MSEANKVISVEFITEESTVPEYITAIEQSGGKLERPEKSYDIPADLIDDYGDAQFEPFTVIAVAVSVGFLIKRISDVWLDHSRSGGQVVDTRGETMSVRRAPYLERGTLVILTDNDTKVYHTKDKDEVLDVLERIALAHG